MNSSPLLNPGGRYVDRPLRVRHCSASSALELWSSVNRCLRGLSVAFALIGLAATPVARASSVAATGPANSEAYQPKQSDRPERIAEDEAGFTAIFDGKTLNGWEGDPNYWRVEDGELVGEITPATVLKSN